MTSSNEPRVGDGWMFGASYEGSSLKDSRVGWGGTVRSLSLGLNKHEIPLYEDGRLVQVFRTDSDDFVGTIRLETERQMGFLRKAHPDRKYSTERVVV